ncbi:MAG: hypothetical protein QMD04_11230 [Anaerolineales bacterium]|nr:hypothetical protein [Anaerolineales bacterium]
MPDLPPFESPTLRVYKRQRFWQILAPMMLVIPLALVAGGFTLATKAGQTRPGADVAVIWLIAPLMLFALLCMVVLGGMIYAIARLTQIIPRYTLQAQNFALRFVAGVKRGADMAVKPVIWLEQARAVLKSLFK